MLHRCCCAAVSGLGTILQKQKRHSVSCVTGFADVEMMTRCGKDYGSVNALFVVIFCLEICMMLQVQFVAWYCH